MPTAAPRPCSQAGCGALVTHGGKCERHKRAVAIAYDAERGSAYRRGYGPRWQKASKAFLFAHPLCQCRDCQEGKLRITAATVVDHKIPHRGDMALFWDSSNWQSMSKRCHDRKTVIEDGRFRRR